MPVTVMPAALAGRLREADLTYSEAGATAGVLPPGYHHLRRTAVIGSGPQVFTAAADALAGWQVHARAGLFVSASSATAGPGSVLVLGLGVAAIRLGAPRRVVYVIDQPDRRGGRRRGAPVLRQATLPADTAIPWWHGRRLHFEFS